MRRVASPKEMDTKELLQGIHLIIFVALVLFAPKPGGGLSLCVDYWGLNEGTIKNWYPLRLSQETLLRLSKALYYAKLDDSNTYNIIRITE
jgi:hypothetical protein